MTDMGTQYLSQSSELSEVAQAVNKNKELQKLQGLVKILPKKVRLWVWRYRYNLKPERRQIKLIKFNKAGNAIRTRDIHLGKVTLYH